MASISKVRLALAKNMKAQRAKLGLSQADLAELVGISVPFIGELEICRKSPSLETLEKIASALKVEPFELLLDSAAASSRINEEIASTLAEMAAEATKERIQDYLKPKKKE